MNRIIHDGLREGLARLIIGIIIAENCLTIPMNIPLGPALVETVMETRIGCIAHHHDFVWERNPFRVNAVDDYILILQPTRMVQRKGIETSIELVRRLEDPRCKLVISHSSEDEGDAYAQRVRSYAELMGVEIVFAEDLIGKVREVTSDPGRRQRMVEHNYAVAHQFFSYARVEKELLAILNKPKTALTYAS